jgi:hopanoid biosynthesis associated radical SAM protein HpnH
MGVPISQMFTVATYLAKQKLLGEQRFPFVLMIEPLYRCNLACAGCGKIQYPARLLRKHLSVEECLRAVDDCPAPVVVLPGGEPLLHPDIQQIVEGIVARRKYLYVCTNAILLEEKLPLFRPSKYLSFSVHLDGDRETHDRAVCRDGIYDKAVSAIRAALARGFRITTNTTLFADADPDRTAAFFDSAMQLGVEGMMVSPGYSYAAAPDQEHFLPKQRTRELFRRIFARPGTRKWRFNQSPLFLEFLTGARDYDCTPWGIPAYSIFGWQRPCYLLQEGYAQSWAELRDGTRWDDYGPKSGNPKCTDCMVHSGFEASAVIDSFSSPRGMLAMIRALLFGPRSPRTEDVREPNARPAVAPAVLPQRGLDAEASPEALRAAFDYRGDVTLTLDDGSRVEGFVSDPGPEAIQFWPAGGETPVAIPAQRVRGVALSGRDPAARRHSEGIAAASA